MSNDLLTFSELSDKCNNINYSKKLCSFNIIKIVKYLINSEEIGIRKKMFVSLQILCQEVTLLSIL